MKPLALILLTMSSAWCAPAKGPPSNKLKNDAQIILDTEGMVYDKHVNLHGQDFVQDEHEDDSSSDHTNPLRESFEDFTDIMKNVHGKPIKIGGLSVSGNLGGGRILYGTHIVIGSGGPDSTSIDQSVLIEGEYQKPDHAQPVTESVAEKEYEMQLRLLFSSMDLNQDRFLVLSELLQASHQNGVDLKEATAKLMLNHFGGTAGVDYAQFHRLLECAPSLNTKDLLHFWMQATRAAQQSNVSPSDVDESDPEYASEYEGRLRTVFLSLDKNSDGILSASDLVMAFREMGTEINESDALRLLDDKENFDDIKEYNTHNRENIYGGLDFNQWKGLLQKLRNNCKEKSLIHYWRKAIALYGVR